ncbi:MAG: hypothetical protein GY730_06000 [bacterium]|nr:hypothetical protein [bacterium]
MFSIALLAVTAALLYYHNINVSEDPRVIGAKKNFKVFSNLLKENKYDEALKTLDEIEYVYKIIPGYKNSYELGVLYNNRAAVYLVQLEKALISTDNILVDQRRLLLELAQENSNKSKAIYLSWLAKMEHLNKEQIHALIKPFFRDDDPNLKGYNLNKIINRRTKQLIQSQSETKRRLSVVYTNLGIIERYQNNMEKAEYYYQKAISLWKENYVAENNLDVLLGRQIKKRSIIKQLFPPKKNK